MVSVVRMVTVVRVVRVIIVMRAWKRISNKPAEINQFIAVIERPDARDVHGVALVVPRVDGVGAAGDGIDLDGHPVELIELLGVGVHCLKHLLL